MPDCLWTLQNALRENYHGANGPAMYFKWHGTPVPGDGAGKLTERLLILATPVSSASDFQAFIFVATDGTAPRGAVLSVAKKIHIA